MSSLPSGLCIQKAREWKVGEDPEKLKGILTEDGLAVVPNVINDEECEEFRNEIKKALTGMNENWDKDKTCAPVPGGRGCGLMKWFGVATAECVQKLRCTPSLLMVFASLYNTTVDDLITSIDALALRLVHSVRKGKGKKRKRDGEEEEAPVDWERYLKSTLKPHQDSTRNGISMSLHETLATIPGAFPWCVQGSVALQAQEPVQLEDGWVAPPGFVAVLGPQPRIPEGRSDFAPPIMNERELKDILRYIPVPKGAVVLWRSDTVHANYGGDKEFFRDRDDFDFARLALMVCAVPRLCGSEEVKRQKMTLFDVDMEARRMRRKRDEKPGASTSHYPHRCKRCGPGHMSNPSHHKKPHQHYRVHVAPLTPEQERHL